MKKTERARSHSWWWDSHVSPINSKWLQENVSEMDAKVASMLMIIEAEADSFAQRAEMFYRKRPELISLLGEFYQSYRALVERHDLLNKEIRLKVAPDLQAQLGVSLESAQNSPTDLSSKRGIDGFDAISPSYSYPGQSEFDSDSPSTKAHTDEDELSPLAFRTNNLTRTFGFKKKFPGFHDDVGRSGSEPITIDVSQLQRDLKHYQEENKALITDVAKLKTIQFEFSSMQTRLRSLEAEDKNTKKKLKSFHEQGQKLEAENLKLNHSLTTLKEEKSELAVQCTKQVEEAYKRNKHLENEIIAFKQQLADIESLKAEHLEKIKDAEASKQKLQDALTSLQEESDKDLRIAKEAFEQQIHDLQKKILALEEENQRLRDQIEMKASAMTQLESELDKLITYRNDLEQLFLDSEKEKGQVQYEKSMAETNAQELQKELKLVQNEKEKITEKSEQQVGEIERLMGIVRNLDEETARLEALKVQSAKLILKLESDIEQGVQVKESLAVQCKELKEKCESLEATEAKLKEHIASCSSEISFLKDEKLAFEGMVTEANLEIKELQLNLSSLSAEKEAVKDALERALGQASRSDQEYRKIHEEVIAKEAEASVLKQELVTQEARVKALENDLCASLKEKDAFEVSKVETAKLILKLESEIEEGVKARERLAAQHKELKDKCETLEATEVKLKEHILSCSSELSFLKNEKLAFEGMVTKATLEIKELQLNLSALSAEKEAIKDALDKALEQARRSDQEYEKIQEEAIAKEAEASVLKKELVTKEACLKVLEDDLHASSKEKDAFEVSKVETAKLILNLESEIEEGVKARESLAAQYKELKEKCESLEETKIKLKEHIITCSSEVSCLKDEKLAFEDLVTKATLEIKELQLNLSSLSAEKDAVKDVLEKTLEQANISNQEYQKIQEKAIAKEVEVSVLKQDLMTQEACLKALEDDLRSSLKEKDAFEASKVETAKLILTLESEVEKGFMARESLADQYKELKEKCEVLEATELKLKEHITSCSSELSLLRDEKLALEGMITKATLEIKELQLNLSSLSAEKAAAKEVLEKALKEKDVLEASNSESANRILKFESDRKEVVQAMETLVGQYNELKKKCEYLEATELKLKEHMTSSSLEISLLKDEKLLFESMATEAGKEIEKLLINLSSLSAENGTINGALEKALEQARRSDEEYQRMHKEAMAKEAEVSILKEEIVTQEARLKALKDDLYSFLKEKNDFQERETIALQALSELEKERCMIEANLESKVAATELQVSSLESEKVNLLVAIHQLEQKCSSLQQQNSELNESFLRTQSDHQIAAEVAHKVQEELAVLLVAQKSLQYEDHAKAGIIDKLKNKVESLEEQIQNSKEDNVLLVKQNQDGTRQLTDFEAQLKDLKLTLSQTLIAHASVIDQLAENERSEELLNQEISGLHAQILILNAEISSRASHEHGLVEQINVLKEQGDSLSADLQSAEQQKKSIMDRLNLTVSEKDALDNKYTGLLKDLENKKSEAIGATRDLLKMQDEILELKHVNTNTQDALNLVIGEKDALAKKYEDLLKDLEEKRTEATTLTTDLLKLQSDFFQLKQNNANNEDAFNSQVKELKKLQQDILTLQTLKLELEKQLHLSLSHAESRKIECDMLQSKIENMQQDHARLEELVTLSVAYRRDAENTMFERSEEIRRQRESNEMLKKDLSSIAAAKVELEQILNDLQKKQEAVDEKLVVINKELETAQHERDQLLLKVEDGFLQVNEKAKMLAHLQEQLESAEANKLDAVEQHSRMNDEWNLKLQSMEKRIEVLNSENLKSQNELILQQQTLMKLNEEITALQAEKESYEREKSVLVNQVKNLERELEDLKMQLHQSDEAVQRFSSQAEALQKSLSSIEEECGSLKQLLQNDKDFHDAAIKAKIDETSCLQMKLAEVLQDFAVQEKLVAELQNRVTSLTEENKDMAFKLDSGITEIMQLKTVIKDLQDVELKEVHDRVLKLQDQNKSITASHREKSAENASLRGLVEEHIVTVSRVEEENIMLKNNLAAQATVLEKLTSEHYERILQLQNESKSITEAHHEKVSKVEEVNMLLKNQLSAQVTESQILTQELDARIIMLQNETKSIRASHEEKLLEIDLLRGQMQEHISTVSKLEKERIALATELDYLTEMLLRTREEHELSVKDAGLLLLRVEELQSLLDKSEEENSYMKLQAETTIQEINQLKDEIHKLQLQVQAEHEEESHYVPVAELDFHDKALDVSIQENGNHRGSNLLEENLEAVGGEKIRRKADSAPEISNAQELLYNLHSKAFGMEEENSKLRNELETIKMQNKKLHVMLSDLQGKNIEYALHLKDSLLTLCEEIRLVAKELQDGNSRDRKFQECVEKLDALQNGGSNSTPSEEAKLTEYGRMVTGDMDVDSLQVRTSELELATTLVLMQHQERVEEVIVLQEAVGVLKTVLRDYLSKVTGAISAEDDSQPNILEKPRSPSIQLRRTDSRAPERADIKDFQETDFITAAKEILQEEYEALETRSIGEDELQGLSRLHINLGTRLHQVLMDEKLETELTGLKEERMKLKEDLQARVEQVERMEAELRALQKLLREGNEKQGLMDQRQNHLWVEKRLIAERRVDKLTEELVLQRQQVSNMKETVLSWAEEQEAVTEELEVQVLDLVSKESAPTMDGWNDEHVEKLMERMKNYKALTRRHSLDLQSVGKDLMRVSSTIEFTQRQLLVKPEDHDPEDEEGETSGWRSEVDFPRSEVSSNNERNQKFQGFRLSWLMLLCRVEKTGSLRRGSSSKTKKKIGCWN